MNFDRMFGAGISSNLDGIPFNQTFRQITTILNNISDFKKTFRAISKVVKFANLIAPDEDPHVNIDNNIIISKTAFKVNYKCQGRVELSSDFENNYIDVYGDGSINQSYFFEINQENFQEEFRLRMHNNVNSTNENISLYIKFPIGGGLFATSIIYDNFTVTPSRSSSFILLYGQIVKFTINSDIVNENTHEYFHSISILSGNI